MFFLNYNITGCFCKCNTYKYCEQTDRQTHTQTHTHTQDGMVDSDCHSIIDENDNTRFNIMTVILEVRKVCLCRKLSSCYLLNFIQIHITNYHIIPKNWDRQV